LHLILGPVARMEPPGPASGRPDDKLRVIRDRLTPDYAALHPGYGSLRRGQILTYKSDETVTILG